MKKYLNPRTDENIRFVDHEIKNNPIFDHHPCGDYELDIITDVEKS
jgi:hypothetical protein